MLCEREGFFEKEEKSGILGGIVCIIGVYDLTYGGVMCRSESEAMGDILWPFG